VSHLEMELCCTERQNDLRNEAAAAALAGLLRTEWGGARRRLARLLYTVAAWLEPRPIRGRVSEHLIK